MKLKLFKIASVLTISTVMPIGFLNSCSNNPTVEKVKVTLNLNGGSSSKTSYELDKGTTYSSSLFEKPTKTDYTFKEWVLEDGTTVTTNYKFEKDVTLKATYTKNITYVNVTLNANGGTISKTSYSIASGTLYSRDLFEEEPTKTGSQFIKWTFNDGTDIPSDYKITSNVTFKAYYAETSQTVKVTLNPNGGTISKTSVSVEKYSLYTPNLFPTPTKSGYSFSKWTLNDGTEITTSYYFTADVTLKAQYIKQETEEEKYINALNLQKVISNNEYLWEATYNDYDDSYSNDIDYSQLSPSCSSFISDKLVGRNLEWTYNTIPDVIVHTPTNTEKNRYATLGVCYASGLSNTSIGKTGYLSAHKNIPLLTLDGINEKGFYASVNEVGSYDSEVGHNPGDGSTNPGMSEMRVVRYLIDHANTIEDVMNLLSHYNIYTPAGMNEMHIFVADAAGNSGIIEFEWNDTTTKQAKHPVLYKTKDTTNKFKGISTNFTFTGYEGDCSTWTSSTSSILPHSEGCERYNILDSALTAKAPTTLDEVLEIMAKVYYTKSYSYNPGDTTNFWYSEFNWYNTKTTVHNYANYYSAWHGFHDAWVAKQRDGSFWITRHSCGYDLVNKKMKLIFEEEYQISTEFKIARS